MPLATIEEAIDEIRRGRMVVLMDDKDRENEGDLCIAAEKVTPQAINFMATHGRGLICLPLTEERVKHLQLSMMVSENTSPFGTAFTVSVDSATGITPGISAADRAKTILDAIADDAKPQDLVTPGHIFPLRARNGGVLVRTGQTEGSVDLARLAGLKPAGVICEIMRDDGEMARMPDLETFSRRRAVRGPPVRRRGRGHRVPGAGPRRPAAGGRGWPTRAGARAGDVPDRRSVPGTAGSGGGA